MPDTNALHDRESEKTVLGCIMVDPIFAAQAILRLEPHVFFTKDHQLIYYAMQRLHADSSLIDPLTVSTELKRKNDLERAGGDMYLYDLQAVITETGNGNYYCGILEELWKRRTLIHRSQQLINNAKDIGISIQDVTLPILDCIHDIEKCRALQGTAYQSLRDIVLSNYDEIRFVVPGIVPEGLTMLAGSPKIGKSFMCLGLALAITQGGMALSQIQIEQSRNVLYLALEDSQRRIKHRSQLLQPEGALPDNLNIITQGGLISCLDSTGLRVLDQIVEETQSECIIIDTWHRAKPPSKQKNLYDEEYDMLALIQEWSTENHFFTIVTHHLRKTVDEDNVFNMIHGTTGTTAGLDSILVLRRKEGQYELHITGRDIEDQEFAMDYTNGLWSVSGTVEEAHLSETNREILELLAINEEPMTPKEISESLDKDVRMPIKRLLESNKITRVKRGYYTLNT